MEPNDPRRAQIQLHKAGNRTQVIDDDDTQNYTVNNLNQLLSEQGFGPTTFPGTINEPATVTVNGDPAKVVSTDGGAPYRFEAEVDLDEGSNTVEVEAIDGNSNTRTHNYSVTAAGVSTLYEHDDDGDLRYEREPNQTVRREFRWDQENRLVRIIDGT